MCSKFGLSEIDAPPIFSHFQLLSKKNIGFIGSEKNQKNVPKALLLSDCDRVLGLEKQILPYYRRLFLSSVFVFTSNRVFSPDRVI